MKVTVRSIEFRFAMAAGTYTASVIARWMIVLDRQANGAAPVLGDILSPAATETGMRSLTNRKRFKIILDKQTQLSVTGQQGDVKSYHTYIKFRRPLVIEYNGGTAGTIADIVSNSFFFVAMTNATGVASPTSVGRSRIRFTDM